MPTTINVEQGGTGVTTVAEIKSVLSLKSAAYTEKSDDIDLDSSESVATSKALKIVNDKIGSVTGVTSIANGGTGSTTVAGAKVNLEIPSLPVKIEEGGTNATTATEALKNLGIELPLSVANGGTGGSSIDELFPNLGLTFPLGIAAGGTGGTTQDEALTNLGISLPLSFENGGTNATNQTDALKNLLPTITTNDDDKYLYNKDGVVSWQEASNNDAFDVLEINRGGTSGTDDIIARQNLKVPSMETGSILIHGSDFIINLSSGNFFEIILSQDSTISFAGALKDQESPFAEDPEYFEGTNNECYLRLLNGGNYTVTIENVLWENGEQPQFTADGIDIIKFIIFSDDTIFGYLYQNIKESAPVPVVSVPSVISPTSGSTVASLTPTIVVSDFNTSIAGEDTAKSTNIDISTDPDFTDIVATYNSTYTTSWTVT